MNCRPNRPGLAIVVGLIVLAARVSGGPPAGEPRPAGSPQPAWNRPAVNPALKIPREKWSLPAVRPPKPRRLTAAEKAAMVPPDWIVVYTPATGEVRYEPPPSGVDMRLRPAADSTPSSTGLLGRMPALLNIIGTDQRQRITPTTDFPWRAVGKTFIQFPNQSNWVGSGALVDPFHVITAGHVVHDVAEGGWATQIEFVPGLDGDSAPFSSAWDVNLRSPAGWVDSQDTEFDWGLITLDRNVGATIGWFGYAYETLDYYPNRTFNLAGYPDELAQGLGLYWAANTATRATDNVLYHVIDSTGGQSGAPIWQYLATTDQSQIVAVHTYGGTTENSGTRINAPRFADLNAWRAADTPPTDYADLIDNGGGFSPPSISSGAPFEVHIDVHNIGTAAAANFDVTFYASVDTTISTADYPIGVVHVASLPPFNFVPCAWSGAFSGAIPLGSYYLGWIIDTSNTVVEISEANNINYFTTPLIVGTPPNLRFAAGDFNPGAPIQLAPGNPLTLAAYIQNTGGSEAGPFWLEFWGSRTGGLTTSIFVANSARPGPIGPGVTLPFSTATPLSSIPDGPYTIVMLADRPNEVAESNELDNRVVIGGKRLLVIRPQTNADLAVSGFTFGPNPVFAGQPITLGGVVRNIGTENSGPFWIEFFGSGNRPYPSADFFLCDSIFVNDLAPGATIDLSTYSRVLYGTTPGTFLVGVVADRLDQVSERDETNNYQFVDGYRLNQASAAPTEDPAAKQQLPDLVVTSADFAPNAPYQAPPGAPLTIWTRVENQSSHTAGPFWLEFWGSRTGGLTLDEFITDSYFVNGLAAQGVLDLAINRSLYSIPDGPYSVVVVADRPGGVAEANEANNRRAVAGKRLLTIRPQTQANLVIVGFTIAANPMRPGTALGLSGRIINSGVEHSGPFWIEFFGTTTPAAPQMDFFLCDSIYVTNVPPGGFVDLAGYARLLYPSVPFGSTAVICFADRTDLVNETHEEDNYVVLGGYSVSP